jgi:hypothetical protein
MASYPKFVTLSLHTRLGNSSLRLLTGQEAIGSDIEQQFSL